MGYRFCKNSPSIPALRMAPRRCVSNPNARRDTKLAAVTRADGHLNDPATGLLGSMANGSLVEDLQWAAVRPSWFEDLARGLLDERDRESYEDPQVRRSWRPRRTDQRTKALLKMPHSASHQSKLRSSVFIPLLSCVPHVTSRPLDRISIPTATYIR